ncbi:hypothetical protein HPB47_008865 [Ixodes persulcatus]|uniref:Uncharacterized protein n=1 Tax=Ixodes persulcatus TaxID=34615 RepID=A0AC60P3P0_IXOPE|nr:hypothetical protein HPB47_008865 [Ixodes persulcatus]
MSVPLAVPRRDAGRERTHKSKRNSILTPSPVVEARTHSQREGLGAPSLARARWPRCPIRRVQPTPPPPDHGNPPAWDARSRGPSPSAAAPLCGQVGRPHRKSFALKPVAPTQQQDFDEHGIDPTVSQLATLVVSSTPRGTPSAAAGAVRLRDLWPLESVPAMV